MVVVHDIYPRSSALGDVIGWELWHRLTNTTYEILSSRSTTLGALPTTGYLMFRTYYTLLLRGSSTLVYSDVMRGHGKWVAFGIDVVGRKLDLWRADDRAALVTAAPNSTIIFDAATIRAAEWRTALDESLNINRASGW